jgi:hypothetical protein
VVCIVVYTELLGDYRLPEGLLCLTLLFNDISSVTSTASLCVDLCLTLYLGVGNFKLSLEVFIEFTIFLFEHNGSAWSFHHFEKFGKFLRQHLQQQQQQHSKIITIPGGIYSYICHEGEMMVNI